jgi:hypothetical protein
VKDRILHNSTSSKKISLHGNFFSCNIPNVEKARREADMSAYELGWIAAEIGKSLKDCPFKRDPGSAIAWRNGYRAMYASVGL